MPTVIIYWSPGRTPMQKSRVIHEITQTLVAHGGARREDVLILFQNIETGDIGRGGQVPAPPPTRRAVPESPPLDEED